MPVVFKKHDIPPPHVLNKLQSIKKQVRCKSRGA